MELFFLPLYLRGTESGHQNEEAVKQTVFLMSDVLCPAARAYVDLSPIGKTNNKRLILFVQIEGSKWGL